MDPAQSAAMMQDPFMQQMMQQMLSDPAALDQVTYCVLLLSSFCAVC